jgi:hypothetical protein
MESKKARTGRLGWFAEMAAILVLLQIMCCAQIHFPARCENSHEGLLFQERDTLPFSLVDGYLIVVEGRIGANRHLRLVVDTGSTHSVLRSDFAGLQMFVRQPARIVNLAQVLKQELVEVPDFELGPLRIALLPMLVHDLDYLRKTAPGVDGVVGLDVLRSTSFSIDFPHRRIAFGSSPTLRNSAHMECHDVYLAVDALILNRSVRLLLDTGVRTILLYGDRMGNRLPQLRVEEQIEGTSLSGVASLQVVELPRTQLNGSDLNRRAVLLRNSPAGFLPELDGYLSLKALGAHSFSFNFEKGIFSWE